MRSLLLKVMMDFLEGLGTLNHVFLLLHGPPVALPKKITI
jgi:hypothetical protein